MRVTLKTSVKAISKQMDPIEEAEPNTIVVTVTKDMTKDAVLTEILRRVDEFKATEDKPTGGFLDGFYKVENSMAEVVKVG